MVAITNTRRGSLPRNRSLENEKPASVENSTTDRAVTQETITEFHTAGQKLMPDSSTFWMLASRLPSGISDGIGFCAIVAASEEARSTEYQIG